MTLRRNTSPPFLLGRWVRLLAVLATLVAWAFVVMPSALADNEEDEDIIIFSDVAEDMDDAPGYDTEPEKENWNFSLGVIAGIKPDYEGSDDYEFAWVPDIRISWRDIIVFRGKSLRAIYRKDRLRAGALVAAEGGRDEDDNNALRGLGDVDSGAAVGAFLDYELIKRVTFQSEFRHEVAGGHGGALLDLGLSLRLPLDKPWVRTYFGTTIASDDYMEEFFAVNANQSAGSGLQQYDADAGVKSFTFSLASGYDITENWVIGATVIYSRLTGDAGDSPIVESRGSKDQVTAGLGLSYQF